MTDWKTMKEKVPTEFEGTVEKCKTLNSKLENLMEMEPEIGKIAETETSIRKIMYDLSVIGDREFESNDDVVYKLKSAKKKLKRHLLAKRYEDYYVEASVLLGGLTRAIEESSADSFYSNLEREFKVMSRLVND